MMGARGGRREARKRCRMQDDRGKGREAMGNKKIQDAG